MRKIGWTIFLVALLFGCWVTMAWYFGHIQIEVCSKPCTNVLATFHDSSVAQELRLEAEGLVLYTQGRGEDKQRRTVIGRVDY